MKTVFPIVIFIIVTGFAGCFYDTVIEAEDFKEDEELREAIFNAIISNDDLLSMFMSQVMDNPEARQQMMTNEQFMQEMLDEETMQNMVQQNLQMMQVMMNQMMQLAQKDSTFRNMMRNNDNWQQMLEMMDEEGNMMHNDETMMH